MRREQILKICLNHALTSDIKYTPKDSKSWQFLANDFSESELEFDSFCLRFKTEDIAKEFKKAIDDALDNVTPATNSDDLIASSVESEEHKKIIDLKLPANFFDYKNHNECNGCRGCDSDNFQFAEVKDTNFGYVDNSPLPLTLPIKIENDLSKISLKPNPFAFAKQAKEAAGFSFAIDNANSPSTGNIFGGVKTSFGSGNESKDSITKSSSFGQSGSIFGSNSTNNDSAKTTPTFSFGSTTFGSAAPVLNGIVFLI